jgi:hypothetical protein
MISQENIRAGGDVAGGDIHKPQLTYNIYDQPKPILVGLIEQLRDQICNDPDAAEFAEKLLDWMNPKETKLKRDLEAKLNACGKAYLLSDALEAKEKFAKQLRRTAFQPALQQIYACILGEIYSRFTYKIKPKIATSNEPGWVQNQIFDLADCITQQIAVAPAEIGLEITEVIGMLYYLTGNCYIEWDYNDSVSSSD